jgi:hypothetical protein
MRELVSAGSTKENDIYAKSHVRFRRPHSSDSMAFDVKQNLILQYGFAFPGLML